MNIRNRIKELRTVTADEVAPNPRNWRTHPQHQRDALRGVLADIGIAAPVIAYHSERHNGLMLIDGHERMTVGVPFPAVILDVSDAEADTLLATFDPITSLATADADKLDALLREVSSDSPAVQQMLDDLAQEHGIVPGVVPGGGGDEFDATPDDAGPTRAELGDLWLIGGVHRLICGDCTDPATVERLMQGERADMVFTDPPYGVGYADKNRYLNAVGKGNHIQVPIASDHDDIETIAAMWKLAFTTLYDAMKPGAVFYVCAPQGGDQMMMMMMMAAVLPVRHELMWLKNNHVLGRADYAYKHEPLLYGWRRDGSHYYGGGFQTSVWEIDKPLKSELHPTMKPVELVERAINNSSRDNGLIIDWFLGSGTTLIAAHRTGRRCYGMEIEPRYADVILRRAEAEGLSVELAERSTESIHGAQAHE